MLALIRLLFDSLSLFPAYLLRVLVDNLSDPLSSSSSNLRLALVVMSLMLGSSFVSTMLRTHYNLKLQKISLYNRGLLCDCVEKHVLRVRRHCLRGGPRGEIVNHGDVINHLTSDTQRIADALGGLYDAWALPLQVALTLYLLYIQVSFAFLGGVVITVALIPVNMLLAKKIASVNTAMLRQNDERVLRINEAIGNIVYAKMCGWSSKLVAWIAEPRTEYMKYLRWIKMLDALCVFFWATTPIFVSLITFGLYIAIGGVLTPGRAVAALSLFNALILPLNAYPWVINGSVQAWVSLKRLNRFLFSFIVREYDVHHFSRKKGITLSADTIEGPIEAADGCPPFAHNSEDEEEDDDGDDDIRDEAAAFLKRKLQKPKRRHATEQSNVDYDGREETSIPRVHSGSTPPPSSSHTTKRRRSNSTRSTAESLSEVSNIAIHVEKVYYGHGTGEGPDARCRTSVVHEEHDEEDFVVVVHGRDDEFRLEVPSFIALKGQLVTIVGRAGAGKSTFLAGLAGEVFAGHYEAQDGTALTTVPHPWIAPPSAMRNATSSSCAFVEQTPFLMIGTIRSNILFGRPYERAKFEDALRRCALDKDLSAMPLREHTLVGERGAGLSGGQKYRVALARALYADAQVYLIDDALGSLDAEVANHIVDHFFLRLAKDGKCVVAVTLSLDLISRSARVWLLKNSRVSSLNNYEKEEYLQELSASQSNADTAGGGVKDVAASSLSSREVRPSALLVKEESREGLDDDALLERQLRLDDEEEDASTDEEKDDQGRAVADPRLPSGAPRLVATAAAACAEADLSVDRMETVSHVSSSVDQRVSKEVTEHGAVSWTAIRSYLQQVGWLLSLFVLLLIAAMQAARNISDWYVTVWVGDHDISMKVVGVDPHVNETNAGGNQTLPVSVDAEMSSNAAKEFLTALALIALTNGILAILRGVTFAVAGLVAAKRMHDDLLAAIFNASYLFFCRTSPGKIINRLCRDVYNIDDALPFIVNILLAQFFLLLGAVIVIIVNSSWIVTAAFVPVAILYYFVQIPYRHASREVKRIESAARTPMIDDIRLMLEGGAVLRGMGGTVMTHFLRRARQHSVAFLQTNWNMFLLQAWFGLRLQFIGSIVLAVVLVVMVYYHNASQAAALGLALAYVSPFTTYVSGLLSAVTDTEKQFVSVERVLEYMNVEPEITAVAPVPRGPKRKTETLYATPGGTLQEASPDGRSSSDRLARIQKTSMWPLFGTVEFHDVSMRYDGEGPLVLRDVSFRVEQGERLAVVGRTGAGKSSLFLALLRVVRLQRGVIRIDGDDVATMDPEELRRCIAVFPQDVFVFHGTLRDNVDPFHKATDDEVKTALLRVRLSSFALDFAVAEGGKNLSVGERYLVALARVSLQHSCLLLLDEPTSKMDAESADLLWRCMDEIFDGCTIVMITHSLEKLDRFDRCLVMEDGVVVGHGSPAQMQQQRLGPFAAATTLERE